jgi:subtilisin family serine protease
MMVLSGTSMATGVTSGVVALMIEAKRYAGVESGEVARLSPNAIKAILQYTAYVLPATNTLTQGAGQPSVARTYLFVAATGHRVSIGFAGSAVISRSAHW